MESLQERLNELISSNANKIADWGFPLSETLEEYNQGLMELEKNLNYSETALIIQNATNVLGKRIDRLHLDTSGLRNSLNEHDVENEAAKSSKSRKKSQYNRLDLDDIKHPDLQKEMTKNCFLKSKKSKKKIKLLSQRYPQLENMCRHKFSLDVIDIMGEKIGKKYDFRCNQQLTSSHMLVDELSPEDLQEHHLPRRQRTEDTAHAQETNAESLQMDSPESTPESLQPNSPMLEEAAETSDLEADDFCEPDTSQESGYGTLTDLSLTEDPMSQNLTPSTDLEEDSPSPLNPPASPKTPQNPPELPETPQTPKKRNRESVDTDAGYTSGNPEDLPSPTPLRRSKRQKKLPKTFQPIPFNSPIPERLPKGRSEFKLPCHISLLKNTRTPRKKRINGDSIKREKLAKFLMSENENRNKLLMYSPSRPFFASPKHETEEFQKVFEERFKKRLDVGVYEFEAVMNGENELKGFSRRGGEGEKGGMSEIVDDRLQEIQEASCSYTPPNSPFFSEVFEGEEGEGEDVGLTHRERIEERMRELRREFEGKEGRGEEGVRWLEAMETLKAAERRKVFSVREYEGRIVERLRVEEGEVSFEGVVEGEEPEDIARLFVASLHLANTYTVDITPSDDTSSLNLSLRKPERSQTKYHL